MPPARRTFSVSCVKTSRASTTCRSLLGDPATSPGRGRELPEQISVKRVRSTGFSRTALPGRLANYATFLTFAAVAAMTSPRPDVIVTMTDPPVAGLIGMLASRRHRRPFIVLSHDVYPDIAIAVGVLAPGRMADLWRALNRAVRGSAARILVVGRDMAEKLAADGVPESRLVFAPCWSADWSEGERARERTRLEAGWNGRFVVMHAGNQGLAQNLPMIADLAERLQAHDDIEVVMLGDGAGLPSFKNAVADRGLGNVTCLPHRARDEAQRLMGAADLHLVSLIPGLWGCAAPSKTYGILSAGRPFVAAVDAGSEPDRIVSEFGCGIRVEPGDYAGLAEAILQLKGTNLSALSLRSRAAFEGAYTRSVATRRIERVLRDVVSAD